MVQRTKSKAAPMTTATRADVRYLGRLLGDVIRTQDGAAVFEAIEGIRQASVAAHRIPDAAAVAALSERLSQLDLGDTLRGADTSARVGPRRAVANGDITPEQMKRVLHWLASEDLLMFASDYPHLHTDDLPALLALMSPTMRANVMAETARRWYRL
jgi:hypothetical protein